MTEDDRSALVGIGAEALADALIVLASRHDDAAEMVRRMLASPGENLEHFRKRSSALTAADTPGRFYEWNEAEQYAMQLSDLLLNLDGAQPRPCEALEEIAGFYDSFESVMNTCHDAYHHVAAVFEYEAADYFAAYARHCEDTAFVLDTLFRLCEEDDYGITDRLVSLAPEFLPADAVMRLISHLREAAESEEAQARRSQYLDPLETLAESTGDPDLFVWCRRVRSPTLAARDQIDIGEAFLKSGDAETALGWLRDAAPDPGRDDWRLEGLMMTALQQVGDVAAATEIARRRFGHSHNEHSLGDLLALIGEDERNRVVDEAWNAIRASTGFSIGDLAFLVAQGRVDEADTYVVQRADRLDGSDWPILAPIAEAFDGAGRALAASLAYRALLDSILQRGFTKAYDHGARYLIHLERLKSSIDDWCGHPVHELYAADLRQAHGRKWSFWKRVDP